MRYRSFLIENFKGIKSATINLKSHEVTSVALIGLNESGKTTILQAIHSFSADDESKVLYGTSAKADESKTDLIPRDRFADFTGNVLVRAEIEISLQDKIYLKLRLGQKAITVDPDTIPDSFTVSNVNKYEVGLHKGYSSTASLKIRIKTGKQQKFREANISEWSTIWSIIKERIPDISYYPTFVFDVPNRIYLTGHDTDHVNRFYKKIFQDILDYEGSGLTISKNIIPNIRDESLIGLWSDFLQSFWGSSSQRRIEQVMDRASEALTDVILSSWNQIFKDSVGQKKIQIDWRPESGGDEATNHGMYVKFQIRDGANRFDIADRSLGFRWFFCFLLFTQFKTHRKNHPGTLFLFDEPASNLHARAQEKLLESFVNISRSPNCLVYSTHSHYMINPEWLDQAYIVDNSAVDYDKGPNIEEAKSHVSDIRAIRYPEFVNKNPGKTTYFQPVLDRLEVKPSFLDLKDGCVLVEGKSDFYILRYAAFLYKLEKLIIIPAFGSSTFSALIPLLIGWATNFKVLLDGDAAGTNAKVGYQKFDLSEDHFVIVSDILANCKEPENLLAASDRALIQQELGLAESPSKKQIMRFFQESLAAKKKHKLSVDFAKSVKVLIAAIK